MVDIGQLPQVLVSLTAATPPLTLSAPHHHRLPSKPVLSCPEPLLLCLLFSIPSVSLILFCYDSINIAPFCADGYDFCRKKTLPIQWLTCYDSDGKTISRKLSNMHSLDDFLYFIPLFSALGPEEIKRVAKETSERSFAKGEVLFLEGEPCRGLYVVKSGRIRIFKSSPEGREQVLLIAKQGDSFNDVPVFDGGPNPASASTLAPSIVYIIPRETLLSLVVDCPVAQSIIELFAARLRHLTTVVEDLSFRSVVSRLAKMLLDLAVAEGGQSPIARLTQDEMAAIVGSVRDVVGRALRALEKANAIKIEGQLIVVIDPETLRKLT